MVQETRIERIVKGLKDNRPQLLRIVCSANDFQMALSALTFFLEEWDEDQKYTRVEIRKLKCYEAAWVVAFYRPFAKIGRSFTKTSRGVALSRKTIGVKFNDEDSKIFKKIKEVRNKVVAHSNEDEMHFRIDPFDMQDNEIKFPQMTFDDGLLFDRNECFTIEDLLHRMIHGVFTVIWEYTQKFPDDITFYKKPNT